jgi:iron(II)-dependent oxidoreductase
MLADLRGDLLDARKRSSRVYADLEGERLLGPQLAIVNPPLWEIGHVGWFQEYWSAAPPLGRIGPSCSPAPTRYTIPRKWRTHALEPAAAGHRRRARLPENVLERRCRSGASRKTMVWPTPRLATLHETCMRKLTYTRQTLAYALRALRFEFS